MSRPRRMSLTTGGTRHKTVTPSPLSQSTSAVHLAIDPPPPHMPRRLSKTRKPFRGLFGGSFDAGHIHKPDVESSLKRGLSLGATVPSSASSTTTDKREKRASFMGRLVKRFSVMRKTDSSRTSIAVLAVIPLLEDLSQTFQSSIPVRLLKSVCSGHEGGPYEFLPKC